MKIIKYSFFTILVSLSSKMLCQDTILIEQSPTPILKSWYPEFKEFPSLKAGQSKTLFLIVPEFENTTLRDHDIHLVSTYPGVSIEETDKQNQYTVSVQQTIDHSIHFELWLELENDILLIKQKDKWIDAKELYPVKDYQLLLDAVELKITNN